MAKRDKTEINETNCLGLSIDQDLFNDIDNKDTATVNIDINDATYKDLLENIDGSLILTTDDMPQEYHGCYWWNSGTFPYMFKKSLKHLLLIDGRRAIAAEIMGITAKAGKRFSFQGRRKPAIDDPSGNNCRWIAEVEIAVIDRLMYPTGEKREKRAFVLRWNPAISSFKTSNYAEAIKQYPDGFKLNWSIHEWEEAQEGDRYYMMRVGEDNPGIVFSGTFRSQPYTGNDWSGTASQRHYVDIECLDCSPAEGKARLTLEELTAAMPEVNWTQGHSGERLTAQATARLDKLWRSKCNLD